jgi:hypothetical protein
VKKELKHLLEHLGTAERANRLRVAEFVLSHPDSFSYLIAFTFDTSYKFHHKAAWTLELVLEEDHTLLLPHIDQFTGSLHLLTNQSAIRPVAKICKWLAHSYIKKQNTACIEVLKRNNISQLVAANFDWLIGEYKVASKAYAMATLYFFGQLTTSEFSWIHPELKDTILQNSYKAQPAYLSQGSKIVGLIDRK